MLKRIFENKELTAGRGIVAELHGSPSSRAEIHASKERLLAELVEATDPSTKASLKNRIAEINDMLEAFEEFDAVELEAELKRADMMIDQRKEAAAAAKTFTDHCRLLVNVVMTRAGDSFPAYNDGEAARWNTRAVPVFQEVVKLPYDRVERQIDEILTAGLERREWREIVTLPKYRAPGYLTRVEAQN